MRRREDWPERLNEYVSTLTDAPFEWGVRDCCMFPANGVLAMTDEDYFSEFRGQYSNEAEALALLKGATFEDIFDRIVAEHGFPEVVDPSSGTPNPNYAQRGDVLFMSDAMMRVETAFGGCAGLSLGPVASFFIIGHGLIMTPFKYVSRAWHIE